MSEITRKVWDDLNSECECKRSERVTIKRFQCRTCQDGIIDLALLSAHKSGVLAGTIKGLEEGREDLNEAVRILKGVVETAEESHNEHGPGCYINEAREWLSARASALKPGEDIDLPPSPDDGAAVNLSAWWMLAAAVVMLHPDGKWPREGLWTFLAAEKSARGKKGAT